MQISRPSQKLKHTKVLKALVFFNIFTATVSGSICNLTSLQVGNLQVCTSTSCPVTIIIIEHLRRISLVAVTISYRRKGVSLDIYAIFLQKTS